MPEDPFHGEEWDRYADHAINSLLPMMKGSAVCVQMVPDGPSDVKFALELGFSIMLDKPIIAMITPGAKVPAKLAKIADAIVEWDPNGDMNELQRRLLPIVNRLAEEEGDDE